MKRTIKAYLPSLTEERLLFREKNYKHYRNPNPYTWDMCSAISQERQNYDDDGIYDKTFKYLEETYGDLYKLAEAKLFESRENKTEKELKEWRRLPFTSSKQCKEFFEDTMYLDQSIAQTLQIQLARRNVCPGRKRFRKWLKSSNLLI